MLKHQRKYSVELKVGIADKTNRRGIECSNIFILSVSSGNLRRIQQSEEFETRASGRRSAADFTGEEICENGKIFNNSLTERN